MPARKDIAGQQFGRLRALDYHKVKGEDGKWRCVCDCGNERYATTGNLWSGSTQSCGCLKRAERCVKDEKLYQVWNSMKNRCSNPKVDHYINYGGKGITVCQEWVDSYKKFRKWSYANGYAENAGEERGETMSIERKDNSKGYNPENCTYIPLKNQCLNKTSGIQLTINGVTKNVTEWAEHYNIRYATVQTRIHNMGWDVVKALTQPREYEIAIIKKEVFGVRLAKTGIYRQDLALRAKMDPTALCKKVRGKRDFMREEAERICEVLGIKNVNELFDFKIIPSDNCNRHKSRAKRKTATEYESIPHRGEQLSLPIPSATTNNR